MLQSVHKCVYTPENFTKMFLKPPGTIALGLGKDSDALDAWNATKL